MINEIQSLYVLNENLWMKFKTRKIHISKIFQNFQLLQKTLIEIHYIDSEKYHILYLYLSMIPSTMRVEWWEYHFSALWSHMCWKPIFYMWFDSLLSWQNHKKKIFEVEWTTYKDAENKMIAVLQNAWILPKHDNRNRTIAQNALMWKWYDILSKDTWNTSEYLHERMKEKFLTKKIRGKLNGKVKYTNKKGSTKKLSVKQFTEYLDNVYTFFSDMWYVLPTLEQSDIDSLIATYWNR